MPFNPPPVPFKKQAVWNQLNSFCPLDFHLVDDKYYCLTMEQWRDVIHALGFEKNKYVADRFDCDSYSREWWAKVNERYEINGMFAVFDFSGKHSYNLLLPHDKGQMVKPVILEPQNLTFPRKGQQHYEMKRGFLI